MADATDATAELASLIDDAIARALQELCPEGGMATSWLLFAEYQDLAESDSQVRHWLYRSAENQSATTSLGLAQFLHESIMHDVRRSISAADGEDGL